MSSSVVRLERVVDGESVWIVLGAGRYSVGRSNDCDIVLTSPAVSLWHAHFACSEVGHDGLFWVEDHDSRNGIRVTRSGRKSSCKAADPLGCKNRMYQLCDQDYIWIGDEQFQIHIVPSGSEDAEPKFVFNRSGTETLSIASSDDKGAEDEEFVEGTPAINEREKENLMDIVHDISSSQAEAEASVRASSQQPPECAKADFPEVAAGGHPRAQVFAAPLSFDATAETQVVAPNYLVSSESEFNAEASTQVVSDELLASVPEFNAEAETQLVPQGALPEPELCVAAEAPAVLPPDVNQNASSNVLAAGSFYSRSSMQGHNRNTQQIDENEIDEVVEEELRQRIEVRPSPLSNRSRSASPVSPILADESRMKDLFGQSEELSVDQSEEEGEGSDFVPASPELEDPCRFSRSASSNKSGDDDSKLAADNGGNESRAEGSIAEPEAASGDASPPEDSHSAIAEAFSSSPTRAVPAAHRTLGVRRRQAIAAVTPPPVDRPPRAHIGLRRRRVKPAEPESNDKRSTDAESAVEKLSEGSETKQIKSMKDEFSLSMNESSAIDSESVNLEKPAEPENNDKRSMDAESAVEKFSEGSETKQIESMMNESSAIDSESVKIEKDSLTDTPATSDTSARLSSKPSRSRKRKRPESSKAEAEEKNKEELKAPSSDRSRRSRSRLKPAVDSSDARLESPAVTSRRKRAKPTPVVKKTASPPPSPPLEETERVLMFTGFRPDENDVKLAEEMGARITDVPEEASVIICPEFKRTAKMMRSLSTAKFVVTADWLSESVAQGCFLDERAFCAPAAQLEERYGFSLQELLSKPNRNRLLVGCKFFITKDVKKPEIPDIRLIIAAAGGSSLRSRPRKVKDNIFVISSKKSSAECKSLLKAGFKLYSLELLMTGILRQEFEPDSHELK